MGTLTIAAILGLATVTIIVIVKKLLFICQPNEVLIFSGTHRRVGRDGRMVGYKIIKGGRKIKLPLIEHVDRMALTNMAISVAVHGAFSNGGIPLNIEGVANIKLPGEEPILNNAIERFLGKSREEIMAIAKETLEGNLRGVLATLTPEEVNENKLKFAQQLVKEADHDLNRLGLVLDTLKIQNVSDDMGYLNSIGRIKSAEIRRDAAVAEATTKAESVVRDAANVQDTELVRIQASIRTLQADVQRKIADAQTQKAALEAEERGTVVAAVAEAVAEVEVQKARIEQVRRQLEADVLEPARAKMDADMSEARGLAAKIIEEGRATAEVLSQITHAWRLAGPNARDVFLMQKLPALVETLSRTVQAAKIDKVTVLGLGGADALAPKLIGAAEQIKAASGVDLLGALGHRLGGAGSKPAFRSAPADPAEPHIDIEVEPAVPPTPAR